MALAISLGAMAGWTICYITKAILEAVIIKDCRKAKLSILLWLMCMGIQGIALSVSLLIEKFG